MTNLNCSAIYSITNTINGMTYIGSARNFRKRRANHLSDLRLSKHDNRNLQIDYNRFGANAFEFQIIEEVDIDDLHTTEDRYLRLLPDEMTYNISRSARGRTARHAPETRRKLSIAAKKRTPENCGRFKGYYTTPFGSFSNRAKAGKVVGVSAHTIERWCMNSDDVVTKKQFETTQYLRQIGSSVIGAKYQELGFGFTPKDGE